MPIAVPPARGPFARSCGSGCGDELSRGGMLGGVLVVVPVVPVVLVPVVVPVVPVVPVVLVPVVACPHAGKANTKSKVRATNIVRK